jgi:putative transposase
MAEIAHLNGDSDWIELEFVEKEETPRQLVQYGIELHLAVLPLL